MKEEGLLKETHSPATYTYAGKSDDALCITWGDINIYIEVDSDGVSVRTWSNIVKDVMFGEAFMEANHRMLESILAKRASESVGTCPVCRGSSLEVGEPAWQWPFSIVKCKCLDCHASWKTRVQPASTFDVVISSGFDQEENNTGGVK